MKKRRKSVKSIYIDKSKHVLFVVYVIRFVSAPMFDSPCVCVRVCAHCSCVCVRRRALECVCGWDVIDVIA